MVALHFHIILFQNHTYLNLLSEISKDMCSFSSEQPPYLPLVFPLHPPRSSKRHHHLHFSLHKRRRAQVQEERRRKKMILKTEMKMRNLKLYMENQSIIEENEKLRKKALLLHKENQTLLFQLQEKFPNKVTSKPNNS